MRLTLVVFFIFLALCGCKQSISKNYIIAYDPFFTDGYVGERVGNVQGFFNELVELLSTKEHFHIKTVTTGPDNVLFSLDTQQVNVIFSVLNPNEMARDQYEFSTVLLPLGPVIVVRQDFTGKIENHFAGRIIGVAASAGSQISLVQTIPGVIIKTYYNVASSYEDLLNQKIDGLLDLNMRAFYTIKNIYQDKLKIATKPLNAFAYRFVARKKEARELRDAVERNELAIKQLRKKWDLP